jgi:hypothetical protein
MLRLTYLGAFFDTFMITSVGGDAVKAVYLAREAPPGRKVESVSVLILDRLLGLLGLLSLMVGLTLLHVRELYAEDAIRPYLPLLFGVPVALLAGTLMLLSRRVYSSGPMQFILRKMPMGHFADRAYVSMQTFRYRMGLVVAGWVMSVFVHLFGVITGYMLITAMHQSPEFGPFLVGWFISAFISSFFPFGGIGAGQALYETVFFKIAGITNGWVLATAVQAVTLLAKLPGLLAWIFSREHPAAATPHAPAGGHADAGGSALDGAAKETQ